ncbi:hypothetical protein PAHAL_1G287200 [Panicum hallii]|uniref:Uncharacterized protein n=1 Tax=Panicum hallii TaxID=206008 RepID=A0A2S3GQF0_9POAL|nr:uncharacterized protein LOC112872616 [Panicum hallii]PAN06773.1 hypothetical protein PAHAL_1G287200 [Panicum hallii]
MDKFLVAAPPHSGEEPATPPPPPRRHRWRRIAVELDGRIDARFRHLESRLLLDSFAEIGAFDHKYYMHGEERCRTYVDRMISASTMNFHPAREGISAVEFDKKGIYLASVTFSGCLTVHDFETLYCSIYDQSCSIPDDSSNYVLHISNRIPLNAVRWNPGNQDEIACTSSQSDKVFLFDIGYVSSAPTEVLQKGKSKFPALYSESRKSLTDIAFTSDDKSRIFASGLDGAVYMWDRRSSKTHCLELMAPPESQFNTVKLSLDSWTVFGATKNGTIHVWDLRGGRASGAFQSHNEVQQLSSVKVSTLLGKIASLKEQSNIVSSPILSIDFNPSCSYQLAFHLDDGWSGVLNINNLSVTHLHCPPPAWLESTDLVLQKQLRKPTWLPTSSIYAVGSSSYDGIYLLDFHPDTTSACHVDKEETRGLEENQPVENKLVPLSQRVLSCAAHPLNHTIIAGTQYSSLLILSQKHETVRNLES